MGEVCNISFVKEAGYAQIVLGCIAMKIEDIQTPASRFSVLVDLGAFEFEDLKPTL